MSLTSGVAVAILSAISLCRCASGLAVNAQLYICNGSSPYAERQRWVLSTQGGALVSAATGRPLRLQVPSPNHATTCPTEADAACYNVVLSPSRRPAGTEELHFAPHRSGEKLRVSSSAQDSGAIGLCLADSDAVSKGYLPNVFLTNCTNPAARNWTTSQHSDGGSSFIAQNKQCLDVGSAGSAGDLGVEFTLLPAAPAARQAFNSKLYASWGGSVIRAPDNDVQAGDAPYHMFAAVFANHTGLGMWGSKSEIMHLVSNTPTGPFHPSSDGLKLDGIVVTPEAHNPTIVRANDGTYLLFSIGKESLLASKSLSGPWRPVSWYRGCNNPAPVVTPGSDAIYVYCHGGPDKQHWGASIGMVWAPHWNSSQWQNGGLLNVTGDLHGGGKDLIGHPVEDPFVWYASSSLGGHNGLGRGPYHMIMHGFRMGMVNRTCANVSPGDAGNAYGAYATAPSPFGPWAFQEARVAYTATVHFSDGTSTCLDRRERPHLLLNDKGLPTHLYNGVCPKGNKNGGQKVWEPNHCYTMVQKIAPPGELFI